MIKTFRFVLILCVYSFSMTSIYGGDSVYILPVGKTNFDHGEAKPKTGEEWFSVEWNDNKWASKKYRINISSSIDNSMGLEIMRRRISVNSKGRPRFLIKGLNNLPSEFLMAPDIFDHAKSVDMVVNSTMSLILNGSYEFFTDTGKIIVTHNGIKQEIIHSYDGVTAPELLWAGDLDGDGKLDFLLRSFLAYCSPTTTLYLSTYAGEGELVKDVSFYVPWDC